MTNAYSKLNIVPISTSKEETIAPALAPTKSAGENIPPKKPKFNDIEVAIIGCYVNGPGESKAADVGLTGATPANLLYVNGSPSKKIKNADLVNMLEDEVRNQISMKNDKNIIARSTNG